MFFGTASFDGDLSSFDVSFVKTMRSMFSGSQYSGRGLENWDTSAVENFAFMFYGASSLDADLSLWSTSKATTLQAMFCELPPRLCLLCMHLLIDSAHYYLLDSIIAIRRLDDASKFRGDGLENWDVSSVIDLSGTFYDATAFSGDLSSWNTEKVTTMSGMFSGASQVRRD